MFLYKNSKNIEDVLSIDNFLRKFDLSHELTKIDVEMFIQEVVDKERYGKKIFKLALDKEKYIFFRVDSELGIFFETIIKTNLRGLNYLKIMNRSRIFESDLGEMIKVILFDLIKKYNIFNPILEESLHLLL